VAEAKNPANRPFAVVGSRPLEEISYARRSQISRFDGVYGTELHSILFD
jgi:hypothetical protein